MIPPSHHMPHSQGPWQIWACLVHTGAEGRSQNSQHVSRRYLSSVDTEDALSLGPRNLQQGWYRRAHCPQICQGKVGTQSGALGYLPWLHGSHIKQRSCRQEAAVHKRLGFVAPGSQGSAQARALPHILHSCGWGTPGFGCCRTPWASAL